MSTLMKTADDVAKRYAALHNAGEPKHPTNTATLLKVAKRAVAEHEAAEFPGADVTPRIEARLKAFLAALNGVGQTQDEDCLPRALRKNQPDPWAELVGAEERLAALAKSALSQITRGDVRKMADDVLVQTHQRLLHMFKVNFEGNSISKSATGVSRPDLVQAAALVEEELDRRDMTMHAAMSCPALYKEALAVRLTPPAVNKGELLQSDDGSIVLVLGETQLLVPSQHDMLEFRDVFTLEKAAEMWSPHGTAVHTPFVEPARAQYTALPEVEPGVAKVGDIVWSRGARRDETTELFVTGAMSGRLLIGKSSLTLSKQLLPYVLTAEAVEKGWMPPEGESALPPSLEQDVPAYWRYWKAAAGEDPRVIRDQLVAAGLFDEESVALVDGAFRRTFTKRYVVEPCPAEPEVFAKALHETDDVSMLLKQLRLKAKLLEAYENANKPVEDLSKSDELVVIYDYDVTDVADAVKAAKVSTYLVGRPDTPDGRADLAKLGRVFKLDGKIFVHSHAVEFDVDWVDLEPAVATAKSETAKREIKLTKAVTDDEQRFVLGVVLEPETVDSQNDIYSAEEIRKSAWTFMAEYRNAGLQHSVLVNEHVDIVESYLSPTDFELGDQTVKKGTWLIGMRVSNDALWEAVKDGTLTGFSIGGSAYRAPEGTAAGE